MRRRAGHHDDHHNAVGGTDPELGSGDHPSSSIDGSTVNGGGIAVPGGGGSTLPAGIGRPKRRVIKKRRIKKIRKVNNRSNRILSSRLQLFCWYVISFIVMLSIGVYYYATSGGGGTGGVGVDFFGSMMFLPPQALSITSWNTAAINNNPFEYWITLDNHPEYESLMIQIEQFIENPKEQDITVKEVFTDSMFNQLDQRLIQVGWKSVKDYWENDFKNRHIIQNFLKDPLLGSKRLASMPDRYTNTINTEDVNTPVVFRPTVINMYDDDLSSLDIWWKKWETFMFDTPLLMNKSNDEKKKVYELLKPISKAKYPDITDQESIDSLPLQVLCSAIFDSILVHMMNTVSTPNQWQPLRHQIVELLNKQKSVRTLQILKNQYIHSDIICLQEVSAAFIDQLKNDDKLNRLYHIVVPKEMDSVRDQNSIILLKKVTFPNGSNGEISDQVQDAFPTNIKVPVAKGDILAITASTSKTVVGGGEVTKTKTTNKLEQSYMIVSFHGDTNGSATIPVLDAVMKVQQKHNKYDLIFGLDANTYEIGKPNKKQDVMEFGQSFANYDLSSCWGNIPQKSNYTTYNARTYLQPQLNKACRSNEKRNKGDVNPKDFILFPKNKYNVLKTWKDNTGKKQYIENMAFPTIHFPSDHGILSTIIQPITTLQQQQQKDNNDNNEEGEDKMIIHNIQKDIQQVEERRRR